MIRKSVVLIIVFMLLPLVYRALCCKDCQVIDLRDLECENDA